MSPPSRTSRLCVLGCSTLRLTLAPPTRLPSRIALRGVAGPFAAGVVLQTTHPFASEAPLHGFFDQVVKLQTRLSLRFAKPSPAFAIGSQAAFGIPRAGGSLGFADPQTQVGYAYVTNKMGPEM